MIDNINKELSDIFKGAIEVEKLMLKYKEDIDTELEKFCEENDFLCKKRSHETQGKKVYHEIKLFRDNFSASLLRGIRKIVIYFDDFSIYMDIEESPRIPTFQKYVTLLYKNRAIYKEFSEIDEDLLILTKLESE